MPGLRDKMRGSWKLFNTWEKLLPARRAAPITARICIGLAGAAIAVGQPRVAVLLLLGFEGVLRSVELFQLKRDDVNFGRKRAALRLIDTKGGSVEVSGRWWL